MIWGTHIPVCLIGFKTHQIPILACFALLFSICCSLLGLCRKVFWFLEDHIQLIWLWVKWALRGSGLSCQMDPLAPRNSGITPQVLWKRKMPLSPSQYSHHKANCLKESDLTTLNVTWEDLTTLVFYIGLRFTSSWEFDVFLFSSGNDGIAFLWKAWEFRRRQQQCFIKDVTYACLWNVTVFNIGRSWANL